MIRTLASFVLSAILVAACSGTESPGAAGDATTSIDRQFIDMMVPHHESAIAMAELVPAGSDRPELRRLADGIVATQGAEIAQLKAWRLEWFGSDATPSMAEMPMLPGMTMGMEGHDMAGHDMGAMTMDMGADVRKLEGADDFDRAFLELMIVHHEMALDAARVVADATEREEIRDFAAAVIEAQAAEIAEMRGWLDAWY